MSEEGLNIVYFTLHLHIIASYLVLSVFYNHILIFFFAMTSILRQLSLTSTHGKFLISVVSFALQVCTLPQDLCVCQHSVNYCKLSTEQPVKRHGIKATAR